LRFHHSFSFPVDIVSLPADLIMGIGAYMNLLMAIISLHGRPAARKSKYWAPLQRGAKMHA
jgi:hypothetical protein